MVWSIDITNDGWNDIYEALSDLTEHQLIEAITDDYLEKNIYKGFKQQFINRYFKLAYELYKFASFESLVDKAYNLVEENDSMDNGGFKFWIDKEGYHRYEF